LIQDTHTSSDSLEIRLTGDGSHTLYLPALDEHYHSHFGAVTESKHIFINAGLASLNSSTVSILEVGFGTGLNALLTAMYANDNQVNINYVTLEKYPLDPSLLFQLNYPTITGAEDRELFEAMHNAPWEQTVRLTPWFTLEKRLSDLTTMNIEGLFDLIYFDAFGPDKQPEMWSRKVMQKITAVTHPGTVLVTYSAKGELKRNLRALGFEVALLPGPPGKRVMTRAVKK
jgi:tRNA U34 5-methylaminomethyl-2-thiouridine-forming methyltransferase MnmC